MKRSACGLAPPDAAERAALAAGLTEAERRVILYQGPEPPFCGDQKSEIPVIPSRRPMA